MGTGTPKLEWTEQQLSGVLGAITTFRGVLDKQRQEIGSLDHFGNVGELRSAQDTRDNLIHDAHALKSKLDAYIAYLDNVHAQVKGDVQFLLTK
ncbi:hypothetical protein HBE99_19620 [Mycobacteroides chelonae]|uniref:hypothetical protein n=1 Tax=Mycobacteroides chelonae TaxID=1774 RepID=UPI001910459F|nr:hypothetical protein [Mycobacteroides chelonae]QQG98787.1 hypothetical protein HBE99_19620 [Mycobacteroides chelonae]